MSSGAAEPEVVPSTRTPRVVPGRGDAPGGRDDADQTAAMDDYFAALEAQQGFIARSDVLAGGEDDRFIRRHIASGTWRRVRNGAYCLTPTWDHADAVDRHLRRARAVAHSHGDAVVLSHVTSLLTRPGCDVWGIDLGRVHVTRRDGRAGSVERDVVHHEGGVVDDDIEVVDGPLVMREARGAVDALSVNRLEPGLVLIDGVIRAGRVQTGELDLRHLATRHHQGSRTVDMALRLADGRSESVGESRARYLYWSQGLPRPEVQYVVRDRDGRLVGTTDLAWPELGLLFEFDGRVKYGRLLRPGQDPGDAVFAEKLREDALRRATGFAVERITWADLSRPAATARRARERMSGPRSA